MDGDAPPPATTTSHGASIDLMPAAMRNFLRGGPDDKKACKFVLKSAEASAELMGWSHAQTVAKDWREKMDAAKEARDYDAAGQAKKARDKWQSVADDEKELHEKCIWAVGHATEKEQYHCKRDEFEDSHFYKWVVDAAKAYLSKVPEADHVALKQHTASKAAGDLYGGGPEHFPKFVELSKKAEEAAEIMAKEMVRLILLLSTFCSLLPKIEFISFLMKSIRLH